jgi:hypothetical protein
MRNFLAGIVTTLIVFTCGGWLLPETRFRGPAGESSTILAGIPARLYRLECFSRTPCATRTESDRTYRAQPPRWRTFVSRQVR